jgi:dihydrofolate synthase/folylpolyglutamate synthase
VIEDYDSAVAFVDARADLGVKPGLERIESLLDLMTSPHEAMPIIHVAGTNGKTTVVRMIRDLLIACGLRVGTFVSPHLNQVEERYSLDGREIDKAAFTQAVADVAPFVEIFEQRQGGVISYFELTAAIGFQLFAAAGVDVAVVEVGLGGRWDATNVVTADVSVITGIAMDHMSYLGDTLGEIAAEKAAILKPGGALVTGPLPAAAEGAITARVAEVDARWLRHGADYLVEDAVLGLGGWYGTFRGIHGVYREVLVGLHGRHQLDHFGTAVVACELFFDHDLDEEVVHTVAAAVTAPGRLEVVGRNPLVILDGAHNEQGLQGLADAVDAEFPPAHRVLVIGMRGDRDPAALLSHVGELFDEVIATAADDPAAIDAATVAAAARAVFDDEAAVEVVTPVAQAVTEALDRVAEDDMVVVAGSLYVVGEARNRLVRR